MANVNPYEVEQVTIGFNATLLMMLQQTDTALQGTALTGSHVGKQVSPVNYIAPLRMRQAPARGAAIGGRFADYQRRWVTPQDKDFEPILVDNFDLLRGITDPKSQITATMLAAVNRMKDDILINAFFSTAQIGGDPGSLTTETFNSGVNFPVDVTVADTIGVGTESGLNIAKMRAGHQILNKYENPQNLIRHMGMTAQSLEDLMAQVEFTSTEFRARATYDEVGRPMSFNGTMFHYSEAWPFNPSDSDERWLPMWVQDGMHLGTWSDINIKISERNDIVSVPWQVYGMMTMGATRLQGGQVVRIAVKDTTGGRIVG